MADDDETETEDDEPHLNGPSESGEDADGGESEPHFGRDPYADDDDDDFDFDAMPGGEEEEEEDGGDRPPRKKPGWQSPIFITSVSLFLILIGVVVWVGITFEESEPEPVASNTVPIDPVHGEPSTSTVTADASSDADDDTADTSGDDDGFFGDDEEGDEDSDVSGAENSEVADATDAGHTENAGATEDALAAAPTRENQVAAIAKHEEAVAPAPLTDDDIKLAPSPDPALVGRGSNGLLPVVAPDGRKAWQVYSRPFHHEEDRPVIAILLAGLGLSQSATSTAIQQLPGTVTLGFAPYAPRLDDWIQEARAAGHEVFLELPMEPFDYPNSDPGPHTLLTTLDPLDNLARLDWLLSRFTGYVGVTNFLGDKFTSSPDSLEPILHDLQVRGLMFLDARTSRNSVAASMAATMEMPRALNNRFLDDEASRVAIDARLFELEQIAKSEGHAVGVGFPYPVTIERLARWAATLENKGITLAPMSAVAYLQGDQTAPALDGDTEDEEQGH